MKKEQIEKELVKMIKDNVISKKDLNPTRLVITWLNNGRKRAEKLPRVKTYIKNLERNGYVDKKTGKLFFTTDKDGELFVEFCLMINGARGFIKRVKNE